jgi:hypothetical protein
MYMLSGCELIDTENIKNKRIIEKKFHYLMYDMVVRAKNGLF